MAPVAILLGATANGSSIAFAGRLTEQPLASAALLVAGAVFVLTILLAARRCLVPTRQRQRGRHRCPLRCRHKTP